MHLRIPVSFIHVFIKQVLTPRHNRGYHLFSTYVDQASC